MRTTDVLEGLNEQQRLAAEAVHGPVCILAGAGSGKTTTITRRIANQVATEAFRSSEILAVTFTDRAAGEMRGRLGRLGVEGVRARTFHSAALAQVHHLGSEGPGEILPSKVMALRQIANTLPKPYRFRPAADLATEVEWAKNRRIGVDRYLGSLGKHEPPIPADLMASVYKRYEQGKRQRGLIDFEDLLELAIQMFARDEYARERFSSRYRAFTVDEYQDVNILQETLLKAWLGDRDELCVVGDDYQSIYGFTGASPEYLLGMPRRFVGTKIFKLETNYRSTPEILAVANRLVPKLGGATKVLRATRDEGQPAVIKMFTSTAGELGFLCERIRELHDQGIAWEQIAVLYRVNFRSEDYEEVLAAAGIPYQVADGAFLQRATARQLLTALRRSSSTELASDVGRLARRAGYVETPLEGTGEQEITRQNDLGRFIRMAEEFEDGIRTGADLAADIAARFGSAGEGRGVNLLTYHRAKGLEFEAVFLPRVEDGELPFRRSRSDQAIAEERRLFYVGITRAKTHLFVTWVSDGRRKASAFVGELRGSPEPEPRKARPPSGADDALLAALKTWRRERSRNDEVPAYVVFHDATLESISGVRPRSLEELADVAGVGPTKLERYGPEVVGIVERVTAGPRDAGRATTSPS